MEGETTPTPIDEMDNYHQASAETEEKPDVIVPVEDIDEDEIDAFMREHNVEKSDAIAALQGVYAEERRNR